MTPNQSRNFLKIGLLSFLGLLVFSVFFAVSKSLKAERKALDTVKQIDYRFTSYDNLFFHTYSVVLDSTGKEIGNLYIKSSEDETEKFYGNPTRRKTRFYYNIMERRLKVIDEK